MSALIQVGASCGVCGSHCQPYVSCGVAQPSALVAVVRRPTGWRTLWKPTWAIRVRMPAWLYDRSTLLEKSLFFFPGWEKKGVKYFAFQAKLLWKFSRVLVFSGKERSAVAYFYGKNPTIFCNQNCIPRPRRVMFVTTLSWKSTSHSQ